MIEIIVKDYMTKVLPVPVYMEIPEDPPKQFVVLEKGDSSRENLVDSAMFVANSYAETKLQAAKLNELVVEAFDNLIDLDTVCSSKRGGDYPKPDLQTKKYCYQAVQNITHY